MSAGTGDLGPGVHEHRGGAAEGQTKKVNIKRLVYCAACDGFAVALRRAKWLKRWYGRWNEAFIAECRPDWQDLWGEIIK